MIHLLIALAIALIAAAPLTYPGPLQTHLGVLHLLSSNALRPASLASGLFDALGWFGLARLDAFKTVAAAALILGVVGIFALVRMRQGAPAALVAAALYALLPYRLMLIYVQGNLPEALFWGLLPWVFVASLWLAPRMKFLGRNGERATWVFAALGLAAAPFLWRLCVPYAPDASQAQAYVFQLFSARWGDGTRGDWLDAVPIQLGLAPLGLTVAALSVRRARNAALLAAVAGACAALSVDPLSSRWAWHAFFNTPWQLVGAAGFCLSLAGGSLFANDDSRDQIPLLAAALTITVLASYPFLQTRGIDFVPTHAELARFDNGVWLLDADLSAPIQAGAALTVTLVWQNTKPLDANYHVFVHILDAKEQLVAQRDRPPLDGARPTTTWRRGEVLRDSYPLVIPPGAPRDLRVAIGMYDLLTGTRVPMSVPQDTGVFNRADRVLVGVTP